MSAIRIGVALTSFNRCKKTESCLRALYAAAGQIEEPLDLSVVLVDDSSTDGTPETIGRLFPKIEILPGTGDLFWAGGMRVALERLYSKRLDFYLWLNDDTVLYHSALKRLLATHRAMEVECRVAGIVVGSTQEADGGHSYGGLLRKPWRFGALSFDRVLPNDQPIQCDTCNGNIVLVSASAATRLGNLDACFRHGMADFDYGLRAKAAKVPVWVMPGYAGSCARDHGKSGSFLDSTLPLRHRWQLLISPKGLPYKSWLTMCKRHTGGLWMAHFVWPYARTLLSSITAQLSSAKIFQR